MTFFIVVFFQLYQNSSEEDCGLTKLPENIENTIRNNYCPKLEEIRNELLKNEEPMG